MAAPGHCQKNSRYQKVRVHCSRQPQAAAARTLCWADRPGAQTEIRMHPMLRSSSDCSMSQSASEESESDNLDTDNGKTPLIDQDVSEEGRKSGSACDKCCSFSNVIIIFILGTALGVGVCALMVFHSLGLSHVVLSCPDGWVGYQGKCYYFPEAEGNWTYSRSNCSALGASLAEIDSLQELKFLKRHKGPGIHWIGLRREGKDQPWKWVNETEFNKLFNVTESENCAYLDSDLVLSSNCLTTKNWICTNSSLH